MQRGYYRLDRRIAREARRTCLGNGDCGLAVARATTTFMAIDRCAKVRSTPVTDKEGPP
jgi:hypothetical protein